MTADAMHAQRDHGRVHSGRETRGLPRRCQRQPAHATEPGRVPPRRGFFPLSTEPTTAGTGASNTGHALSRPYQWERLAYAQQVVRVTRRRSNLTGGNTSTEVSFYITSLSAQQAGAEQLGGLVRGHWGIENRVHYVARRHLRRRPQSNPDRQRTTNHGRPTQNGSKRQPSHATPRTLTLMTLTLTLGDLPAATRRKRWEYSHPGGEIPQCSVSEGGLEPPRPLKGTSTSS